jgi:beta-galactosidase GanA
MSVLLTRLNEYKSNIKEMMYDLVDDLIDMENQIETEKFRIETEFYGELDIVDRFYNNNDFQIGFVFMENYFDMDRCIIATISENFNWFTLIDNRGEVYHVRVFNNNNLIIMSNYGKELINLKIPIQYKNKPYVISMQTDEVYRHKLELYQIDLIKMYCKNARFEFNNKNHKMFQQFMESFEEVNNRKQKDEQENKNEEDKS